MCSQIFTILHFQCFILAIINITYIIMKQTSPNDLLDGELIIVLSSDSEEDQQYPPINSKDNIYQSVFKDESGLRRVGGVNRSSFNFQDSMDEKFNQSHGLSESFSALNGSVRDEDPFKSKLKSNKQEPKESDYHATKDVLDLNMSLFTDRPANNGFTFNRTSSDKDEEYQQQVHEQKPFEMEANVTEPVIMPVVQKEKPLENEIKVILRSTNYFLQKANGDSLMVNGDMLRDLYDEFFKKELFIPLFKYERFDEWNTSKDKFNSDLEAYRIFKISLERYIKYINYKYPKEFDQVFKLLEEIQRGKVAKKRQQSSFNFLNFDFTSIVEYLKNYISSPKTQILRKTLLAKIRSVRQIIKMAQLQLQLKHEVDSMKEKIEKQWNEFGQVELLLNFQQTEYYCTKKIENSPELKFRQIWIKYREFIRNEKTHHAEVSLKSILI